MEAEVRKSGRPPLSGDRAITLEEQRERKKGLQQLVRKNMRLRKVRQLALSCRKDRQGPNSVLTDDDEDLLRMLNLWKTQTLIQLSFLPLLTDEVSSQQIYRRSKVSQSSSTTFF